jgi:amino acid permease
LKVISIVIFFILGIVVNAGANTQGKYGSSFPSFLRPSEADHCP